MHAAYMANMTNLREFEQVKRVSLTETEVQSFQQVIDCDKFVDDC